VTNRIAQQFTNDSKTSLIMYLTAGDPHLDWTVDIMEQCVTSGADIIEIGIPFSEPMAEGPVIQRAMERALANKVTTQDVFACVRQFRKNNKTTPIVLMGYLNPVEVMGYEVFAKAASESGADGVLMVDLPVEEAKAYCDALEAHQLAPIFLVSQTTSDERLKTICSLGRGFIYFVSLKGVTGSNTLNPDDVTNNINIIKQMTDLPVVVGFGIKDKAAVAKLGVAADGVVVGSALVKAIAEASESKEAALTKVDKFTAELKSAC